jgi:polyisoprenyl-phosphate glycosyltransferase
VGFGFVMALCGLVLAVFEVIDYFAEHDKTVPGYTSLAVLLLLLAGFIIVSIGVVGLYVGRIFEQVKERPLYLIDAEAAGPPEAEIAAQRAVSRPEARTPARVPPESETS